MNQIPAPIDDRAPIDSGEGADSTPLSRRSRSNADAMGHNPAVANHVRSLRLTMPDSYLSGRARSFGHAFRGLRVLLQTQHNARIHAVATVLVVAAGVLVGLGAIEWGLIACAIAGVWTAEALNTSIEFLVDLASPEQHPLAAKAKDVAAGAVLLAAIGSAVIGGFVFGPHLLRWLE